MRRWQILWNLKRWNSIQPLSLQSHTDPITLGSRSFQQDEITNIPQSILSKLDRHLHNAPNSPLCILKQMIQSHFDSLEPGVYHLVDSLPPAVSTQNNFDDLLIPKDHSGRSPSDTYYINSTTVLRTHTSAHQSTLLKSRLSLGYLVTADVYRRDEIDASHYPVFHQMEGIRLFDKMKMNQMETVQPLTGALDIQDVNLSPQNDYQPCHSTKEQQLVTKHLKRSLEKLMAALFSSEKDLKMRWIEGYFPFTQPSWELEVWYQGKWLEVCGCGMIHQTILDQTGNADKVGWAFGLGLERIAMVLFDIPDIRLFWSQDPRFISQFKPGTLTKFEPFSKYPSCYKDISFWCPIEFHDNDFSQVVRDVAGDLVESVTLVDQFTHPKTGKISKCFRVQYRSMERTLANDEVDQIQDRVRQQVQETCHVQLR